MRRTPDDDEKPVDNQFYARDDRNEGTLCYHGTLDQPAESVFLKVYADDKLIQTESQPLNARLEQDSLAPTPQGEGLKGSSYSSAVPTDGKSYAFSVPLKAGLVKYKVEFGTKTAGVEKVLHTASNLVCGDAFLLDGQSNAVAEAWGPDKCEYSSEWIRSIGSMGGDGSAGWETHEQYFLKMSAPAVGFAEPAARAERHRRAHVLRGGNCALNQARQAHAGLAPYRLPSTIWSVNLNWFCGSVL